MGNELRVGNGGSCQFVKQNVRVLFEVTPGVSAGSEAHNTMTTSGHRVLLAAFLVALAVPSASEETAGFQVSIYGA